MALLIKKTGLLKADGTEIPIANNENGGIFVRWFPQGEEAGFGQKLFLSYYTDINAAYPIRKFSTIDIIYNIDENGNKDFLPTNFLKEIPTFEDIIANYEQCQAKLPPNTHPMAVVAWGYHNMIKEKIESLIGENTVIIRLDLM